MLLCKFALQSTSLKAFFFMILVFLLLFRSILPQFIIFTNLITSLKLDGFLVQLPGNSFGRDLQTFGAAFKEILTCLADFDPSGKNCMKTEIEKPGWV